MAISSRIHPGVRMVVVAVVIRVRMVVLSRVVGLGTALLLGTHATGRQAGANRGGQNVLVVKVLVVLGAVVLGVQVARFAEAVGGQAAVAEQVIPALAPEAARPVPVSEAAPGRGAVATGGGRRGGHRHEQVGGGAAGGGDGGPRVVGVALQEVAAGSAVRAVGVEGVVGVVVVVMVVVLRCGEVVGGGVAEGEARWVWGLVVGCRDWRVGRGPRGMLEVG